MQFIAEFQKKAQRGWEQNNLKGIKYFKAFFELKSENFDNPS